MEDDPGYYRPTFASQLRSFDWLQDDLWRLVKAAYGEPQRHYHNLKHIRDLAKAFHNIPRAPASGRDYDTVAAAIVFHDIVYDPTRNDNEEQSAEIARAQLTKLSLTTRPFEIDRVCEIIIATKTHKTDDPLGKLMMDLDMSILATNPQDYHNGYAKLIRKEYSHVPLERYVEGRLNFLWTVLESEQIFFEDRDYQDQRARHNVAAEIGYLTRMPKRYLGEE